MNIFQPSCISLLEVILENFKYNLGREYEFYATILLGQSSKGGTTVAIRKEIAQKKINLRTTLQAVSLEVYISGKGRRTICSIYPSSVDLVTEEDIRDHTHFCRSMCKYIKRPGKNRKKKKKRSYHIINHSQTEKTGNEITKEYSIWREYYSSPDDKKITTRETEGFSRYV